MPFGVRPEVAGAGEGDVADQLDGRAQRLDRLLRRLQPSVLQPGPDEVGVADDEPVQRQPLGQRPLQPLLARRRCNVTGHRPAGLGHDVGERGVADVELPQRGAGAGPSRAVAVQRQPGDQLQRLGPLERHRPTLAVDDVDRPEHPHHQFPRRLANDPSARPRRRRRPSGDQRGAGSSHGQRLLRLVQYVVDGGQLVGTSARPA